MAITCQCPSCSTKYNVADKYSGKTIKCPKCQASVSVPVGADVVVPSATTQKTTPATLAQRDAADVRAKPATVLPQSGQAALKVAASDTPLPAGKPVVRAVKADVVAADTNKADGGKNDHGPQAKSGSSPAVKAALSVKPTPKVQPSDEALVMEVDFSDDIAATGASDGGSHDLLGFADLEPSAVNASSGNRSSAGNGSSGHAQSGSNFGDFGDLAPPIRSITKTGKSAASKKRAPTTPATVRATSHAGHKKTKPALPAWVVPVAIVAALASMGGMGFAVYSFSSKTNHAVAAGEAAKGPNANEAPKGPVGYLVLEWPEEQRMNAAIMIDGETVSLPEKGAIKLPIAADEKSHKLVLKRSGFQNDTFPYFATAGETVPHRPNWIPLLNANVDFAGNQDIKKAREEAKRDNKNVLILFDASDGGPARKFAGPCQQFVEQVVSKEEFKNVVERDYVCVYIDNPATEDAKKKIDNPAANLAAVKDYEITDYPTVVVTDAKGRPFGMEEGYTAGGWPQFKVLCEAWQHSALELKQLYSELPSDPKAKPNLDTARKLLDFIELNHVQRLYADDIVEEWRSVLPKGELRPVTKEMLKVWTKKFERADKNSDLVLPLIAEFDEFKKTHKFANPDEAAGMHMFAARALALKELYKEAVAKLKEGLAYKPHNEMKAFLESMMAQLGGAEPGKRPDFPVGSGTGYCIAQGCILTNHHVIEGAKKIAVRFCGTQTRATAKLIGDDADGDMALLQIEVPAEFATCKPVPIATNIHNGETVCALGFPGVLTSGSSHSTPVTTNGIVSQLPDDSDEQGFIVTNTKVNPGNSGGPLCNMRGYVVGMVTRKSFSNSTTDSYGEAIPAARLLKFLAAHLPSDRTTLVQPSATAPKLDAEELYNKLSPSVVYIENIQ